MRPAELILALLSPEPLSRETRREIARLLMQLLRQTQHAPLSEDSGA